MPDRDRLINELKRAKTNCLIREGGGCIACTYRGRADCVLEIFADYLLANGVIVPPCKVGEKAYFVLKFDDEWQICEETVVDFSTKGFYYSEYTDGHGAQILVPYDEIGENVFFDKLQAEAKLRELSENA